MINNDKELQDTVMDFLLSVDVEGDVFNCGFVEELIDLIQFNTESLESERIEKALIEMKNIEVHYELVSDTLRGASAYGNMCFEFDKLKSILEGGE